jgi:hypothetical protein
MADLNKIEDEPDTVENLLQAAFLAWRFDLDDAVVPYRRDCIPARSLPADACNPLGDKPRVLSRRDAPFRTTPSGEHKFAGLLGGSS